MKEETTPTAGLQVDDIKRVTPLIRALYMHQIVSRFLDELPDTDSYVLNGTTLYENGYLLLRPISSIIGDEAQSISKHLQVYSEDLIDWINGNTCHEDFNSMWAWLPCIQFLYQNGFAMPYYDGKTSTIITVDMQVSAGIIKLKS